jgi:putative SOS response-associated peptidase YedK
MCGRFALFASGDELAERFRLAEAPALPPRYNVAPTQPVAAVRAAAAGRQLALLRWGLIPSWASDPSIGNRLLNARAETVADKPSFRAAFRQRRCLLPASGFYEWQKAGAGRKQPYFLRPKGGGLFALAGLWERWQSPAGEAVESCTVLTTAANELMRPLHDRMPVLLDPASEEVWLDPRALAEALRPLLTLYPGERMAALPVGPWVSDPRHEGARCLDPAGA